MSLGLLVFVEFGCIFIFQGFNRFDSSFSYVRGESPLFTCFLRILVMRGVLSFSLCFLILQPTRYGDNLANFSKLAVFCTTIGWSLGFMAPFLYFFFAICNRLGGVRLNP